MIVHFTNSTEESLLRRAAEKRGCSVAWIARAGATRLAAEVLGEESPEIPETISPARVRAWNLAKKAMFDTLGQEKAAGWLTFGEYADAVSKWFSENPAPGHK